MLRLSLAQRATLVVFPELSLTGYYPGDLLDSGRQMPIAARY